MSATIFHTAVRVLSSHAVRPAALLALPLWHRDWQTVRSGTGRFKSDHPHHESNYDSDMPVVHQIQFSYHDFKKSVRQLRLLGSGSGNKDVAIENCAGLLKASLKRAYSNLATSDSMDNGHPP